jgi:hypothetical protein
MTEYNYYISDTEYINKNDYNVFLKNIYNNLLFDKNMYDIPILTNTDMCNCNINSLTNIKFLTSGSNDVYIADIINSCITKSTYFNNNVKHVILKVCKGFNEDDDDDEYECLYTNELITSILYSRLVINNITSNLLLLFGYMNSCKLKYNDTLLLNNKKNESIIFNSYVNGTIFKNLKTKLDIRQVFELFYSIICCYASYGYCISDINLENFMTKYDKFNTLIKIYDKMFYFNTQQSVCIIDYQTDNKPEKIINLKKYIYAISKLLNEDVKNELLQINQDTYENVMKQFINCHCFKNNIIYDTYNCKKYREITFNVLSKPVLLSGVKEKYELLGGCPSISKNKFKQIINK